MIKYRRRKGKIKLRVGLYVNRWNIIEDLGKNNKGKHMFLCECMCPRHTRRVIDEKRLIFGETRSCGCIERDKYKHGSVDGLSNHPLYSVWKDMVRRCYTVTYKEYFNYGYRGIYIVDEWYTPGVLNNPGFRAFFKWATENGYQKGLEIDRINNDGPYGPDNCRWSTKKDNINNRRVTRYLLINNKVYAQRDAERLAGWEKRTIYSRLQKGYTIDGVIHEILTGEKIKRDKCGVNRDNNGNARLLRRYNQPDKEQFYKNDTYYHLEFPKYKHLLKYAPHILDSYQGYATSKKKNKKKKK